MSYSQMYPTYGGNEKWVAIIATISAFSSWTAASTYCYPNRNSTVSMIAMAAPATMGSIVYMEWEPPKGKMHIVYQAST